MKIRARLPAPVTGLVLALFALFSCASQGEPGGEGMPFSYESPLLRDAVLVTDAAEAQRYLLFTLRVPKLPVAPSKIWVEETRPREFREVAFIYHMPAYGTVEVGERPAITYRGGRLVPLDTTTLLALAEHQNDPLGPNEGHAVTPGAAAVVVVRGTQALLIQGQGLGRVEWIEDGIHFIVQGSALSPSEAQALANAL